MCYASSVSFRIDDCTACQVCGLRMLLYSYVILCGLCSLGRPLNLESLESSRAMRSKFERAADILEEQLTEISSSSPLSTCTQRQRQRFSFVQSCLWPNAKCNVFTLWLNTHKYIAPDKYLESILENCCSKIRYLQKYLELDCLHQYLEQNQNHQMSTFLKHMLARPHT